MATGSQKINEQVLFPNRVRKKYKKEVIWLFQVKRVNKYVLKRVVPQKEGWSFQTPKDAQKMEEIQWFQDP